ncbi:MAG: hypothetical protein AABZ36_09430, partial [Nitrospirota bacterium]
MIDSPVKKNYKKFLSPRGGINSFSPGVSTYFSIPYVSYAREQNNELKRPKYIRTAESNITTAFVYDSAGRRTQTIGPWYDTNRNGIVDTGESSHPTEYKAPVKS